MKNKLTIALGVTVLLILVAYMFTFQVNFNEAAVVTFFGAADSDSVIFGQPQEGDAPRGAGVLGLGNLHFKLPAPIQRVYRYDTRVRVLEDRLEEQVTRDTQSVIVSAYLAWRIENPFDFYRSLVTVENAERELTVLLRAARGAIGQFTFDELTNTDPSRLKLAELEQAIRGSIEGQLADLAADGKPWGVSIESVGVRRIILPPAVTRSVFDRMRATRETIAEEARAEGDASAAVIRAEAKSDAGRILSFAQRRAEQIRAEGDAQAARLAPVFAENEGFAIFLRRLETYKRLFNDQKTVWFFDRNQFPEISVRPTPEMINGYATQEDE